MKNHPQSPDDAYDHLKFENELLNIKLGLEFGLEKYQESHLDPEIENAWLESIYEFEKQFKHVKQSKVYDVIGCPAFPRLSDLQPEEVAGELKKIVDLLWKHSIVIDYYIKYDDALIYQFITEEFFQHEIEHISAGGFVHHFSYESFHPNHPYDLEHSTRYFLELLFEKKWNVEFDSYVLDERIMLRGKSYDSKGMDEIIQLFQADRTFEMESIEFSEITFDINSGTACVDCSLVYRAFFQEQQHLFRGDARFTFNFDCDYWRVSSFHIPGF